MELDKEQQARLTFLAEAETYFNDIETVLLGLTTADDRTAQINIAMRAAHSVKGTAGMMGFMVLAQVAHHLEDSFKILRARQLSVDTHLETLLLQGVDYLRIVRQQYQDQQPIDSQWFANDVEPIFEQLNQRLGELTPEDEARLMSEDNNENLDFIIFTTSVDDTLEEFEEQLPHLNGDDLRQALLTLAKQMTEFGLMAQLDSFVSLCQSVQEYCTLTPVEDIRGIAHQATKTWRRCHALVLLGRTEGLPREFTPIKGFSGLVELPNVDVSVPKLLPELPIDLPSFDTDDIAQLQDQFAALNITQDLPTDEFPAGLPADLLEDLPNDDLADLIDRDLAERNHPIDELVDLEALQDQFANLEIGTPLEALQRKVADPETETPLEALQEQFSLETETALEAFQRPVADPETETAAPAAMPLVPLTVPPQAPVPSAQKDSTVRVSVEQLKQINSTFESLILDRNAVNLKLEQLQAFSELMQQRMVALASFNKELRQWYDQASTEGPISVAGANGAELPNGYSPNQQSGTATIAAPEDLDVLEFDRYSKLHLLAQEHMETIVKLEEVSRDIELGLNEVDQAVGSLNYTSRTLKNRITQTQMRPFAEIVGRFPRVVRDWSVQYGKRVEFKLEGGTTLIEQFALDQLSDPLMHLLRNAFDHGIETPEVRLAHAKPAVGTIALRAVNRGNRVVITLRDDGGGIDLERVRDRIRQYGLPPEQVDTMEQQELVSFIFEPGFSTSSTVTELSGRGYGMDVVRTNLTELQGDIQVATALGQGTTFTITIPLSLSILRVMLLERSTSVFALPVDMVQEIIRTPEGQLTESTMPWKEGVIPLIQLENHWAMQSANSPLEMSGQPLINCPMVVVVGENENCYGLVIDRFWQEQEVAIRSVASPMPLPSGFSGVTVLGDGRVIPLLEPIRLMEWIVAGPAQTPTANPVMSLKSNASRILVVDDSIHARRYLATTLERSGYLVEQAKDGREAVDKLLGGLVVKAVICDIEMPRLDGYGVLEELRNEAKFGELPILMLTSRSSEKHRKLAMNLGATAYFSKPYNEQELLTQLKQLTGVLQRA
ncbi:hybrid sensor histidine kinase/response regulator [Leptothoe sp. PORK10 BA2]|uniref:hybrid sensor histidine kinase/response regulator n=1 Tax=Leptothoe sp. PORK10 BA2 TaxID=3110254 RepID=UPI002B1FE485|nr:hybrid sensor histidine kinase/response regulator [Leptothoe sp. PORK10 BA2]MEA5466305.1 hybrid sensor histidine kinase/response regulator [Leptothoe sp. PORK10 BA2]